MTTRDPTGRIAALVEPAVQAVGFDLEQVTVQRVGSRSVVRIAVDRDGGVDLDGIAVASHAVSAALDAADPLPGSYTLEVSSPGVDRPLTAPRHWRRSIGRLVGLSVEGGRLTGRVVSADEDGVDLVVDGQPRRVGYREVTRAAVEVEFAPPAALRGGPAETERDR